MLLISSRTCLLSLQAIFDLHAERIGHGYNVVENEDIYKDCLERRIHFECCPTSSLVTGAVGLKQLLEHPILQFAADDANFSINSDDPTITGTYVSDEYDLLKSWGLNEAHFIKAVRSNIVVNTGHSHESVEANHKAHLLIVTELQRTPSVIHGGSRKRRSQKATAARLWDLLTDLLIVCTYCVLELINFD